MVEKNSHEELMEAYEFGLYQSIETAEEAANLVLGIITPPQELESLKIQIYVISDSIIFIQDTLTQRGLLYIISYCRILIGSCLADGIPIRGAISYGPVSVEHKRGTTIVGRGLTKAYDLESRQQWAGGIVDKECFDVVSKENQDLVDHLINDKENPIITKYSVPQKGGSIKEELALDWTIYKLIKNSEDIRSAFSMHNKEINEDVEIKIQNTIKFFNDIKK